MIKYISLPLTLFLAFTFQQVHSQSGFQEAVIITQEKDTLRGHIHITKKNEYLFAEDTNQTGKALSPDNISAILIDKHTVFESKRIALEGGEQSVFLKLLVNGKSKLYQLPHHKESAYWIETDGNKMYVLTNEKLESFRNGKSYVRYTHTYRGILKNIFNDQPKLFPEIDKLKYNEASIVSIYQRYHEESHLPYELLYEEKPFVVLEFGLISGMQFSSVEFRGTEVLENYLSPTFTHSSNISFGIFAEAKPVALNKRSSIKLELQHHRASYTNRDMALSMNNLKISLAYKYQIAPDAKLKPYLSLGPAFNFLLSLKDQSTVDVLDYNWLQSGRIQYGLEASAGVSANLSQKHSLFLELRYGFYNGNHLTRTRRYVAGTGYVPVQDSFDSITKSLGILAGIRF